MHIAAGRIAIFVAGTAIVRGHLDLAQIAHDRAALFRREKGRGGKAPHFCQRHCRSKGLPQRAAIGKDLPGAATAFGHHDVVAHRIIDHAGHRLAVLNHRCHDRKERQPAGKIGSAINGIDVDHDSILEIGIEQFRIGRNRFLADDDGIGAMRIDGGGDDPLGADIGFGDEVECASLGLDRAFVQPPEARHDLLLRSLFQDGGEAVDIHGVRRPLAGWKGPRNQTGAGRAYGWD
ncbi:hypothetical protein D3C87_1483310 [compost metagenome]